MEKMTKEEIHKLETKLAKDQARYKAIRERKR
jgi:hypothetical protein